MNAGIDSNGRQTLTALSSTGDGSIVTLWANPTTHRLLVDLAAGAGTVTSVSVVSANGFAGTVATATSTPAITLTTSINAPVLAGNGTALVAGTTTGSGSTVVLNGSPTIITPSIAAITVSGGIMTFPTGSTDTLVAKNTTDTLTNKRISKRVVVTTQSATPTINTDNGDIFQITGLAQAITSFTTNLSGTPVAGDMMMIQITDNGTARAITWGASFASTTVTLPTTTVISTMLRVLFQRNNANNAWDCIGTA